MPSYARLDPPADPADDAVKTYRYYQTFVSLDPNISLHDAASAYLAKLEAVLKTVGGHQLFKIHNSVSRVVTIPSEQSDNFLSNANQSCNPREIPSEMAFKLVIGKENPDSLDDPCYKLVFQTEFKISDVFDVNSDFQFNKKHNLLDDIFISRTVSAGPDIEDKAYECLKDGNKYIFYWLLDQSVPLDVENSSSRQFAGGIFKFKDSRTFTADLQT